MKSIATPSARSFAAKKAKESNLIYDQAVFQHSTGDTYDGEFEVKKKEKTVTMHGAGTYKTAEGDIYEGIWDHDKLVAHDADVTISFTDGSKYQGGFDNWQYDGKGQYLYPDGTVLKCDFAENCPSGDLALTDTDGNEWLGHAEYGYAWFEPVNHFYDCLERPKVVKAKRLRSSAAAASISEEQEIKEVDAIDGAGPSSLVE